MEPPGSAGAPATGGREIVFLLEVPSAQGLPRPEVTIVKLEGFGIDGEVTSLPLEDEATAEPGGWLFPSAEALKAAREAEKAAAEAAAKGGKDKKGDKKGAAPVQEEVPLPEPSPSFRLARPCGSARERQQLLDDVCGKPLRLTLLRQGEAGTTPLGTATLELRDLIHATGSVESGVPLQWSPELLAELRQEAEEKAAALAAEAAEAAAAAEEAGGADGAGSKAAGDSDGGDAQDPEPPQEFEEPPPGEVQIRVSTAGPIGRLLCPEDLDDWARVTVKIEGCYSIPEAMVNAAPPPPAGVAGVHAEHPLRYSIRMLGLEFNGGELVMPEIPEEDPAAAEAAAAEAAAAAAEPPEGGDDGFAAERRPSNATANTVAPVFSASIGEEEFVEGLLRFGFTGALSDGPAIFNFLDVSQQGSIGPQEFARLDQLGALPATRDKLLAFRDLLREKYGESLDEAFSELDSASEGSLDVETFKARIGEAGFAGTPEEGDSLFSSLDCGSGFVTRQSLKILDLTKNIADMFAVQKVTQWLFATCGSAAHLVKVIDEEKAGSISAEAWTQALQRLGYPNAEEGDLVFKLMDSERRGSLDMKDVVALENFDATTLLKAASSFCRFAGINSADEYIGSFFAQMKGGDKDGSETSALDASADIGDDSLSSAEFEEACERIGFSYDGVSSRWLFTLLDVSSAGRISVTEVETLRAFELASQHGRIIACKNFMVAAFGSANAAFSAIFDEDAELFKAAESGKPSLIWPQQEVSGYRGRSWLQRLMNTLGDDRGRNIPSQDEGMLLNTGGAWLHFFPVLVGQPAPVDVKDADAPSQANAKVARWHHGQAFVGLRRLAAPVTGEDNGNDNDRGMSSTSRGGPELEFRVFLSQSDFPDDIADAEAVQAPFGKARTYVKGVIRLDRPLARLSPRSIKNLPEVPLEVGGPSVCLVPPPPEKAPPPTASEELESEARKIVGRLALQFAQMCNDQNLREPQVVGPGSVIGPHCLLGRKIEGGAFFEWLQEQDNGGLYKDLAAELRPAIVRLVRSEARDGPSCGLSGNEKDAMYTSIREMILTRLVRSLNHDVDLENKRRDARVWKGPGGNALAETDENLSRLVFEYETQGKFAHAAAFFKERLALPQNAENGNLWFDYARFLMRNGQQQLDAEKALRFAMSLRQANANPNFSQTAFLAAIMMNTALPCSVEDDGLRFDAACSLLSAYADRLPSERMVYILLFVVHAVEAGRVRQRAAEAAAAADDAQSRMESSNGARLLQLQAEQAHLAEDLSAKASKYLEIARQSDSFFGGTLGGSPGSLGQYGFSDFEALRRRERLNRGEVVEPASNRPSTPAAWQPQEEGIWERYEAVHRFPSQEDKMAVDCIDLFLHLGIPSFVDFLVLDAVETYDFMSAQTAASERCQLQRIRASMLAADWAHAEELISQLFTTTDRIVEAHVLLGECRFRAAREKSEAPPAAAAFGPALEAFRSALDFEVTAAGQRDMIPHLRLASIYFAKASESGFRDEGASAAATEHLKRSLLIAPTADAWYHAGICAYHDANLKRERLRAAGGSGDAAAGASAGVPPPTVLFSEANRFFAEANMLDRRRPEINAWLAICATEMGRANVAKQAIRHVLRYAAHLDAGTALQTARTLLRFSDEARALPGERPVYVQDARYAPEAKEMLSVLLAQLEDPSRTQHRGANLAAGEAHLMLAQVDAMLRQDEAAVLHFRAAIPLLDGSASLQDEAFVGARACAARLLAQPVWKGLVEEDIAEALERRRAGS
eukprot:TRINITY_DN16686_c1_g3_i1.p1 TRINITY_DN16686_c1_g3~~TRINITY_DN16686_c1_g3_i1.p1  ORF type:complete len:1762 (-),score=470.78 TRINITY_DN16686_c1_g3_i1:138-5423(-)